ncbi:MAG: RES domain-containing protein [Chryseobacterium sp.]|nr:MAG: RES domain-containing protein [Chryseobacterium sp.]
MSETDSLIESDDEGLYDFFEDEFIADLDSWYSADIKCCEKCYDDFIENWPISIDRLPDSYLIDVHTFYSGSNLKYSYTVEEYKNNLYRVRCPRCNSSIDSNFWAFNFDFDNFEDFEGEFWKLKNLIKHTPFLVLKNDLANRTFELLEELAKEILPAKVSGKLFRGRVTDKPSVEGSDLLPPPATLTKEGRYNHIGVPVIYAASKAITCFNELRKPSQNLYIAEFRIFKQLRLLDLTELEDENSDLLKAVVISSLASAKADDQALYKPEYYFTRYIADCCRYLGLDGLVYPSAQIGEGCNYILFDIKLLQEDNIESIFRFSK